ncbi:hypothetical protein C4901_03445 [Acidiferrobacter sp. SPIII_3]|uniref:M23 family metallopeptidase n=1 Tax=Acidiferrobacter sp. SPIII_3 TaxID=1281578 RepID=UPI000D7317B5|nr:M23 family metallopeptidase [Acidiferrobacter sp. SPIII_3]AWP22518.1 hypothetical protein C4901_03445 [Acidiferrobacter sp. SPIII_3]
MNVIILREGDARSRPVNVNLRTMVAGALILFGLLPLTLGALAFWLVAAHAPGARAAGAGVPAAALGQARRLARISHTDLSRLAARVGRLRARASRLDALSARLGALARLPGRPVAMRAFTTAPAVPISDAGWTVAGLKAVAQRLKADFTRRSAEMTVLASVLAARRVMALTTPGGWPVRGGWISSPFGPRPDPFTGRPGFHPGVDIAAPIGTPVRAMAAGIVIFAGGDGGFGRLVKVEDGHGEVTMYAHLSARYVHVGQVVSKHELLGRVGDTGYSTGPHLHFEVMLHGVPINPIGFLRLADRH